MTKTKARQKRQRQKRQVFRSQYGRPGLSVSVPCPTLALRSFLGRQHVSTPDDEVERMVRENIKRTRGTSIRNFEDWTTKAEDEAVRAALWFHAENRAEYHHVMQGG